MRLDKAVANVRPLVFVSALALFVVLFLDWRVAEITTPGVEVSAGTSGWSGWGAVAGILLIAFFVWELRLLRREDVPRRRDLPISTLLALGAAGFAIVGFFTGSANVQVGGVVAVSTDDVQFAAYVGLVLALVLAGAAGVRYVQDARSHPLRPRATPHGAA